MMKRLNKTVLFTISILTFLVIIILLIIFIISSNKNRNEKEKLELQEKLYKEGLENPGLVIDGTIPKEVNNTNIFFTVEGCIKTYIEYANKENKKAIYSLLDYKIIGENKLTENNIDNYFLKTMDLKINRAKEMYEVVRTTV